jgi:hypothetical protein
MRRILVTRRLPFVRYALLRRPLSGGPIGRARGSPWIRGRTLRVQRTSRSASQRRAGTLVGPSRQSSARRTRARVAHGAEALDELAHEQGERSGADASGRQVRPRSRRPGAAQPRQPRAGGARTADHRTRSRSARRSRCAERDRRGGGRGCAEEVRRLQVPVDGIGQRDDPAPARDHLRAEPQAVEAWRISTVQFRWAVESGAISSGTMTNRARSAPRHSR